MRTRTYSARTFAKGRRLLGVSLMTFGALSLMLGIGHTELLLGLVAAIPIFFFVIRCFPTFGWFLMGMVDGFIASRSHHHYYGRR